MKLAKGTNKEVLYDKIGKLISVCVVLDDGLEWKIARVDEYQLPDRDARGIPTMFTMRTARDKATFMFYPAADKDYQIVIDYYPPSRRG